MPADSDYSQFAEDIAEIEVGVTHLLEQLVESIERSKPSHEVEAKAHKLALETMDLAKKMKNANFLDMGEHADTLDDIEQRADELMAQMPDSLIHSEQKKWAEKLEEISTNLYRLREAQSFLSSSFLQGRQQENARSTFLRILNSTKAKFEIAKEGILHKKHVSGHPTYLKLSKIRNAISKVKGHLKDEGKRKSRDAVAPHSQRASEKMKMFFARELEGKVHIDFDVIRMTSKLTGREEEWVHNEINGQAVEMLFSGTEMLGLIAKARKRDATIIASFTCRPDSGGLLAEIDAHERVVSDDGIIARPFRARIYI